jgi:glycosyltransferase involved in cell wall biosynthesis
MEKYTVIIPVRDGGETLDGTLRTCLRQTYKDFEIIVSDNYSSDNTKKIVDGYKDPRIRYINPGHRLSMSGNFEFALGHVKDGFVMFIGSDDGIMPDAVEYVDSVVRKYKVQAVSCRQATYIWPNFPDKKIAGRFVFGGWRNDVEIRKSSEWINKTLSFQLNYCFDLPNLYCGFVHKSIIDKAYINGSYFKSITPDAYSAFATAIFTDTYAFSHRAFSIAGASRKSNGASAMNPSSSEEESCKFYLENDLNFYNGFVNCPSYEVIAAEAFAQVSHAFPHECTKYLLNYKAMLNMALHNINIKTERDVKDAVAKMAINFGVDLKQDKKRMNRLRGKTWSDAARAISSLFSSPRVAAITKSEDLGVKNIDDAALIAYALEQIRSNTSGVISNNKYIKQLLKQRLEY